MIHLTGLITIADVSFSDICFCPSSFTVASTVNNSCGVLDIALNHMKENYVSCSKKANSQLLIFNVVFRVILCFWPHSIIFLCNILLAVSVLLILICFLLSSSSPLCRIAMCYEVMSAKNYHLAPIPSGLQPQHLATISLRNRR